MTPSLRITHSGSGPRLIRHTYPALRLHVIFCPQTGCPFAASATSDGLAIRALGAHLVYHEFKRQQFVIEGE